MLLVLAARGDDNRIGNHEGRQDADAESTDRCERRVLALEIRVLITGRPDLKEVILYDVLRHTGSVVADRQNTPLGIPPDLDTTEPVRVTSLVFTQANCVQ